MACIHARSAFINDTWASNVRIAIGGNGLIDHIETPVEPGPDDENVALAVPGIPNGHSHAFQRALAGRTEYVTGGTDTFWTWRDGMYRLAARLGPEHVSAIAERAYMEMLEAGYTAVAEFHYLHHQPDGAPCDPVSRLAGVHVEAAGSCGIRLTLVPTLYASRTFGDPEVEPEQRRFANSTDAFLRLVGDIRDRHQDVPLGIGLHSLRAVPPEALDAVTEYATTELPHAPIHIHIAEQQREVDECIAFTGQRPVEWLLDHCNVDARWALVHATHATPDELKRVASTGATVVLCPTTEANLGDGIFSLAEFTRRGGSIAIGSDSQVCTDPWRELQMLEYGQRLAHQHRNIGATSQCTHTGSALYRASLAGGRSVAGRNIGIIAEGRPADLLAVTDAGALPAGLDDDGVLDALVFADSLRPAFDVMAGGHWQVRGGRHVRRDEIVPRYDDVMKTLFGAA